MTQPELHFDGDTFSPPLDAKRLTRLLDRVRVYMLGHGGWLTLSQIKFHCGGSEGGVSARLRDLRKERFGGYRVDKERRGGGLWVYRVRMPEGGRD